MHHSKDGNIHILSISILFFSHFLYKNDVKSKYNGCVIKFKGNNSFLSNCCTSIRLILPNFSNDIYSLRKIHYRRIVIVFIYYACQVYIEIIL